MNTSLLRGILVAATLTVILGCTTPMDPPANLERTCWNRPFDLPSGIPGPVGNFCTDWDYSSSTGAHHPEAGLSGEPPDSIEPPVGPGFPPPLPPSMIADTSCAPKRNRTP